MPTTFTLTLLCDDTGTIPWHASTAVAPASVYEVWHSTVVLSAPLAVITGGGFDTWMVADAVLFGAGLGSAVADVTFADATMLAASGCAQSFCVTVSPNWPVAPTASEPIVQRT